MPRVRRQLPAGIMAKRMSCWEVMPGIRKTRTSYSNRWEQRNRNDFGFFDMHGNCFTWCQDRMDGYPVVKGDQAVEDKEGKLVVISKEPRVLRGGSFSNQASVPAPCQPHNVQPAFRVFFNGLRPARTFTP